MRSHRSVSSGPGPLLLTPGGLPALLFSALVLLPTAAAAQQVIDGSGVENLGASLLVLDLNGDKKADIVAGAPWHTAEAKHRQGRVLVLLGGKTIRADRAASWLGAQTGGQFGAAVAAGDLDGDGNPDLAVGAPATEKAKGSVYLLRGGKGGGEITGGGDLAQAAASFWLKGASEFGGFGSAIAIGDLDGDGLAELVVSETSASVGVGKSAGRVLVFRGRRAWKGPTVTCGEGECKPGLILVGRAGEGLGQRLLIADVTGDGIGDLVATSPAAPGSGDAQSGRVVVIAGKKDLLQGQTIALETDEPDFVIRGQGRGRLGSSLGALDLDGDGKRELLVGEPGAPNGALKSAGAVWAITLDPEKKVRSTSRPEEGMVALRSSAAEEEFGESMAVAQVEGEPRLDLLAGSPAIGRVALFPDIAVFEPAPEPARAFMPPGGMRSFGASVAAGDLGGDGRIKVVIGAPAGNKLYIY